MNILDKFLNFTHLDTSNMSLSKVILVFYLIIGNNHTQELFSGQLNNFIKNNRQMQHIIGYLTVLMIPRQRRALHCCRGGGVGVALHLPGVLDQRLDLGSLVLHRLPFIAQILQRIAMGDDPCARKCLTVGVIAIGVIVVPVGIYYVRDRRLGHRPDLVDDRPGNRRVDVRVDNEYAIVVEYDRAIAVDGAGQRIVL